MNTKILSQDYKRKIARDIVIDMEKEILGALDMVAKDINEEHVKLLHAHKMLFVATVESELCIEDKITMYEDAEQQCLDILNNRKHTKKIRLVVHKWCRKLELRVIDLKKEYRTGPYMLIKAHQKAMEAIEDLIRIERENSNGDRHNENVLLLLLMDLKNLEVK